MTGPEHYQASGAILEAVAPEALDAAIQLQRAQVRATLAHAAAAAALNWMEMPGPAATEWNEVARIRPKLDDLQ